LTFVEDGALGYQYESVLIENIVEEGSQESREEFKMRIVKTRNARTSFRDLGFDGGGTFSVVEAVKCS
jgi:hypothetical protein